MNHEMRRAKQRLPLDESLAILEKGSSGVLALWDGEEPYAVPLSYVYHEGKLYFHCARDGFKVQCLRANPQVCLACVCDTHIIAEKFTTEFASAILRGTASEVTDDAEKIHALRLLCQHHTPAGMDGFDAAVAQSLSRTAVWKIEISDITGKRKKYDSHGEEMKFGREE